VLSKIRVKTQFYYDRGDYPGALEAAREGLTQEPEDQEFLLIAAMSALVMDDLLTAEHAIENLLRLQPEEGHTHLAAGLLKEAQKRDTQAELHFRKAIQFAPENARFRAFLGTFLGQRGRLEEGITVARKGLKLEPQNVTVLHALQRLYRWNKEPELSEQFEQRALALAPDGGELHLEAGFRLLEKGDIRGAKGRFLEKLRAAPADGESMKAIAHERVKNHPFFRRGFLLSFKLGIQIAAWLTPLFWFALSLLFAPLAIVGWLSLVVVIGANLYHGLFLLCRHLVLIRMQRGRL